MDLFTILSEQKIKKAYEDGEFDRLPGFGKPLCLEDDSHIPQELRMAYRIMKNAGFSSEENTLRKEILRIEDLIRDCEDQLEKEELKKNLNEKLLKLNGVISKRRINTNSSIFKNYEHKIEKKLL
ncbi:MAG: DnaJ family domain-containing protein [Bacillota bacterium]